MLLRPRSTLVTGIAALTLAVTAGAAVGFLAAGFADVASDDAVLSAASRREMQQVWRWFAPEQSVTTGEWAARASGGYGYGLNVIASPKLGTVVSHSGGLPGLFGHAAAVTRAESLLE